MINNNSAIGTLAAKLKDDAMFENENVVKVFTEKEIVKNNFPLAINFSRKSMPSSNLNVYHHIGIYSYKTNILEKFIDLDQTINEKKVRERPRTQYKPKNATPDKKWMATSTANRRMYTEWH